MCFFPKKWGGREIPLHKIPKQIPNTKKLKISKYLKNRPLPIFTDKKYNEAFEEGYKHAINLTKKIEKKCNHIK
jgi:hypothetical protein